jgi:hypothetical protein
LHSASRIYLNPETQHFHEQANSILNNGFVDAKNLLCDVELEREIIAISAGLKLSTYNKNLPISETINIEKYKNEIF